ncbi:uncharacterized protein BJ171DRAFT_84322 [Polychytrium aggregatum]|uniref:uncharacterized protein n=1 Tax=Polychytrium aggregatum TaxID=110093 RepID=UPI0022FE65D9|nr:uncharacterized protein BJ171DRAFT_84322 [Polychytrium aggregatum]KAI9205175.1 hypothetical protein BJ171DRAFT_84322 [Polychytrium aggregatum]
MRASVTSSNSHSTCSSAKTSTSLSTRSSQKQAKPCNNPFMDRELVALSFMVTDPIKELGCEGTLDIWLVSDTIEEFDCMLERYPNDLQFHRDVLSVGAAFLRKAICQKVGSQERFQAATDAIDFFSAIWELYPKNPTAARKAVASLKGGWWKTGGTVRDYISVAADASRGKRSWLPWKSYAPSPELCKSPAPAPVTISPGLATV